MVVLTAGCSSNGVGVAAEAEAEASVAFAIGAAVAAAVSVMVTDCFIHIILWWAGVLEREERGGRKGMGGRGEGESVEVNMMLDVDIYTTTPWCACVGVSRLVGFAFAPAADGSGLARMVVVHIYPGYY